MVLIPKDDKPAMIIELKWNQDVETASLKLKRKNIQKYWKNIKITY